MFLHRKYLSSLLFVSLFSITAVYGMEESKQPYGQLPTSSPAVELGSRNIPRSSRTAAPSFSRQRRAEPDYSHPAGCDDTAIGACGAITLFFGTIALVTWNTLKNHNASPGVVIPCTIPSTLDPATPMNTSCWSHCEQISNLPLVCSTTAYDPLQTTAGELTAALQFNYGSKAACVTTYDCSTIGHTQFQSNVSMQQLLHGTSARSTIKEHNARVPKHAFKNKRKK